MSNQRNAVILGTAGTVLEWADFTFFAYLAPTLAQLFFPEESPSAGLIATYGIFAISFLVRPLGAILFGYIADRQSRKQALLYTVLLMAVATAGLALLPTYQTLGLAAPILLLVFRLLQNLAIAGETTAAVFVTEHATKNPYLQGSFIGNAATLGFLLGSIFTSLVTLPQLPEWAWRIPFLFTATLTLILYFLRRHQLADSDIFSNAKKMNQLLKSPLAHLLRHHARALSVAVTIAIFLGVYTYTCSVYFSSVLTHYAGFSRHTSSWIITIGQMSVMIWTPIWAYWADQYGGKRILSIGFLLGAITPSVLWMLALSKTFSLAVLSQCLYGMTIASVFGPAFFFITRLFPVTVRGTGFPLAWNTGMALFGGTAPLIATALAQHVHFMAPPVYVSMIAVLSAIIVWKNAPASSALEVESTSA